MKDARDAQPLLLARIDNASGDPEVDETLLADLLASAYAARRRKPACLDLVVMSDPAITKLNRRHLGKDNPTDVLAFVDGEDEDGRLRLGDIAISAETARREAAARGVQFNHELVFYGLHGLLHLLGMEDDDDDDRAAMLRAQAKAMRDFGIDPGEGLLKTTEETGES